MMLKVSEKEYHLTPKADKHADFSDLESVKRITFKCAYPSLFFLSEDSDYTPAEEDSKGRPPAVLKKSTSPISSSSHGRPRRKVGRPRKYSLIEEGYSNKGLSSGLQGKARNSL